jgi:hypothetical protein
MFSDRVSKSSHQRSAAARRTAVLRALLFVLLACCAANPASAQREPVHYFFDSRMPPGVVGTAQLLRGGPLPGYFQPVELSAPDGAAIALAVDGRFEEPQQGPALAGMLIGQVYRLKITRIPRNEGLEVFPTIEVINRLYPPQGLESRYPIPVQFTLQELEMALDGRLVTRVIYLEDTDSALPVRDEPGRQRYFEVRSDDDPLKVADRLGRPVAIMRMGSRTPDYDYVSQRFLFSCPPLVKLEMPGPVPDPRSGLEQSQPPVPRVDTQRRRWGYPPVVPMGQASVHEARLPLPPTAAWMQPGLANP